MKQWYMTTSCGVAYVRPSAPSARRRRNEIVGGGLPDSSLAQWMKPAKMKLKMGTTRMAVKQPVQERSLVVVACEWSFAGRRRAKVSTTPSGRSGSSIRTIQQRRCVSIDAVVLHRSSGAARGLCSARAQDELAELERLKEKAQDEAFEQANPGFVQQVCR